MKITIETDVKADIDKVWTLWNNPEDIKKWNTASPDWHTTSSTVDLREGGSFSSRMEAKDGSFGFDFGGTYTRITPKELIEFKMSDNREVRIEFSETGDGVHIKETFDAETENNAEMQRTGWQSILDNFASYVEGNP